VLSWLFFLPTSFFWKGRRKRKEILSSNFEKNVFVYNVGDLNSYIQYRNSESGFIVGIPKTRLFCGPNFFGVHVWKGKKKTNMGLEPQYTI